MVDKNFLLIVFLVLQVGQVSSFWPFLESSTDANVAEQRHFRPRRQEPPFCMDLNEQISVQDIVKSCSQLIARNGKFKFIVKEEPTDWNKFTANVISIVNIEFIFDGSSLTTIEFPKASYTTSSFTVKNNKQLTSFKITSVVFDTSIVITGNSILDTVVLQDIGIKGLTGAEFLVENNAQLKTIDMGKLTKMSINGAVTIQQNENLKTINMGTLTSFKANSMVLEKNSVLEKLEMPQLADFTVTEKTTVRKNGQLAEINFNQNLAGTFSTPLLEIEQNDKLTNVAIKAEKVTTETATVRGNRLLSKDSLDNLSKITASKTTTIQELGECIFDSGPVKDLSELDGCVVISGGLKFTGSPTGSISNRDQLKTINGDVDLDGLSSDAAGFLANVAITGAIKSSICDFKLPQHQVSSPTCPITKAPSTSADPKSPVLTTATGTVSPSGQDVSSGETSIWSRADVLGGFAASFFCGVLLVLFIILVCVCCPIGGVKIYKRVFSCCNKKDYKQLSDEKYDDNKQHKKKKDKKNKRDKKASSQSYTTDETVTKSTTPKAKKSTTGRNNSRQTITRSTENTTSAESVDQRGSAELHEEPTQKTDGKGGASIKTGRQGKKKSTDTGKQRRKKSSKAGKQGLQIETTQVAEQSEGNAPRDNKELKSNKDYRVVWIGGELKYQERTNGDKHDELSVHTSDLSTGKDENKRSQE